jgi:prephenate dehydrogenase
MKDKGAENRAMEIGIIGGKGDMGRWFARFFSQAGYTVHIAHKDEGMSLAEMGARCSVVMVSVPIGVTCEVIEKIGPAMRKDALLMDITSIKAEPVEAMLRFAECDVIGCHPLFGPEVPSLEAILSSSARPVPEKEPGFPGCGRFCRKTAQESWRLPRRSMTDSWASSRD